MTRSEEARRRVMRARRARAGRTGTYTAEGRRGGRHVAADAAEQRAVLRLVICGAVFVALVVVKLLFPGALGGLARSVGALIGRDADFRAAFSAVGRAVSGEAEVGDSLQDAYTAVFNPAPRSSPEQTAAGAQGDPMAAPAAYFLRYVSPGLPQPDPDPDAVRETVVAAADAPAETPGSPAVSTLTYTYQAPPDNASLEQRNLGFPHCTPVLGGLNSDFGWREHPVVGGNKFHYGIDIGAAEGTDILAFADGTVYATGESSTLGNYIMLQHDNGYITLYAHCSRVTATGGAVAMGEKIAEVGATGQVTGPHLHFELHDGDLYLNPIYYVALG